MGFPQLTENPFQAVLAGRPAALSADRVSVDQGPAATRPICRVGVSIEIVDEYLTVEYVRASSSPHRETKRRGNSVEKTRIVLRDVVLLDGTARAAEAIVNRGSPYCSIKRSFTIDVVSAETTSSSPVPYVLRVPNARANPRRSGAS